MNHLEKEVAWHILAFSLWSPQGPVPDTHPNNKRGNLCSHVLQALHFLRHFPMEALSLILEVNATTLEGLKEQRWQEPEALGFCLTSVSHLTVANPSVKLPFSFFFFFFPPFHPDTAPACKGEVNKASYYKKDLQHAGQTDPLKSESCPTNVSFLLLGCFCVAGFFFFFFLSLFLSISAMKSTQLSF